MRTGLDPDVRRLAENLGGVESLEALLVFVREPGRWISSDQVAAELHVIRRLDHVLEALARQNLLDVRLGRDVLYRFVSAPPTLVDVVHRLAAEYSERRLLVMESLGAEAPARSFADAFRIRSKR
jgi:hypothetical protein